MFRTAVIVLGTIVSSYFSPWKTLADIPPNDPSHYDNPVSRELRRRLDELVDLRDKDVKRIGDLHDLRTKDMHTMTRKFQELEERYTKDRLEMTRRFRELEYLIHSNVQRMPDSRVTDSRNDEEIVDTNAAQTQNGTDNDERVLKALPFPKIASVPKGDIDVMSTSPLLKADMTYSIRLRGSPTIEDARNTHVDRSVEVDALRQQLSQTQQDVHTIRVLLQRNTGEVQRLKAKLSQNQQGNPGPKGDIGPIGPRGPVGPGGHDGGKGNTGQGGPPGQKGETGASGNPGPKGDIGPVGPRGPLGPGGHDGGKGHIGQGGPPGQKGETGASGNPGPKGDIGPIGPRGPVGPGGHDGGKGHIGQGGPPGQKGETGASGDPGPKGDIGPIGSRGPVGPGGHDGRKGHIGQGGPPGQKGETGASGVASSTAPVAFHVERTESMSVSFGVTIAYNRQILNHGGGYNPAVGVYTVPESGTYVLTWTTVSRTHGYVPTQLVVNGIVRENSLSDSRASGEYHPSTGVVVLALHQGDHVYIRAGRGTGTINSDYNGRSTFSGWKLS